MLPDVIIISVGSLLILYHTFCIAFHTIYKVPSVTGIIYWLFTVLGVGSILILYTITSSAPMLLIISIWFIVTFAVFHEISSKISILYTDTNRTSDLLKNTLSKNGIPYEEDDKNISIFRQGEPPVKIEVRYRAGVTRLAFKGMLPFNKYPFHIRKLVKEYLSENRQGYNWKPIFTDLFWIAVFFSIIIFCIISDVQ